MTKILIYSKEDLDLILELEKEKNEQLQQENKQLRQDYAQIVSNNCDYLLLEQENKQLKDNWNKLKEYIREAELKEFEKSFCKRYSKTFTQVEIIVCNMILDKMQELEQGSDSND